MKVGPHLSEKLEVNVGVHHGSVLSPLLFDIVIDVVTNKIKGHITRNIAHRRFSFDSGDHGGTADTIL